MLLFNLNELKTNDLTIKEGYQLLDDFRTIAKNKSLSMTIRRQAQEAIKILRNRTSASEQDVDFMKLELYDKKYNN